MTIAVDATRDGARLRVIDAGPGVPEAERERIFGRFERGGRAGAGFGLGLAIARGLARQMGGEVSATPGAERRMLRSDCCQPARRPSAPRRPRIRSRTLSRCRPPARPESRATAAAGGVSHSTGHSWTGALACMSSR